MASSSIYSLGEQNNKRRTFHAQKIIGGVSLTPFFSNLKYRNAHRTIHNKATEHKISASLIYLPSIYYYLLSRML